MAAAPWSGASSMRSPRSEACGSPSPASSRGAPSRTGASISPRSRASPISSPPRPRRRRARRIAQAEGGARALYESWREELVKAQALAEAGLDFADEADVAADAAVQADAAVAKLLAAITHHLADRTRRAAPRRLPRRHRRTAQRRQVVSAECARAARRGHRVGGGGDDPRCHRGPSRLEGIACHRHRHGGDKSCTRCGRSGGDPAHACRESRTPISCCGWSMPPRRRRVPRLSEPVPRLCASSTRLTS